MNRTEPNVKSGIAVVNHVDLEQSNSLNQAKPLSLSSPTHDRVSLLRILASVGVYFNERWQPTQVVEFISKLASRKFRGSSDLLSTAKIAR